MTALSNNMTFDNPNVQIYRVIGQSDRLAYGLSICRWARSDAVQIVYVTQDTSVGGIRLLHIYLLQDYVNIVPVLYWVPGLRVLQRFNCTYTVHVFTNIVLSCFK